MTKTEFENQHQKALRLYENAGIVLTEEEKAAVKNKMQLFGCAGKA